MKPTRIAILAALLLVAVGVASAAQTRLNITMEETVDQNVTFADQFYLTETQQYCTITGIVNVTNPSPDTVSDVNMTFTNTINMLQNFTLIDGRNGSQIAGVNPGDTFIVHIPELRQSEYSTFQYTINCSDVEPPLNVNTTYANVETGINRKVLAGHNWTITQNVTNQLAIGQPINNINITIDAQGVDWNGTLDYFALLSLVQTGDWANVHGNGTSNSSWWWQANGGTVAPAGSANITFAVQAPYNVPTSNTYMAIKETLTYEIYYLASDLSLDEVLGVAQVEIELDKRIVQPADNENSTNVTWEVNTDVIVPINISYNLTTVSVWVTATLDPTDTGTPFGNLSTTYTPETEINMSIPWSGSPWYFNYTDASNNATARPPIVWMRPYFTILNAYSQIVNSSLTRNGNDLYMKYIYVVNGYWLQIDKNITSIAADQYLINTRVENIGNAWTPTGLVVTVYDFVPAEFAAWNWSEAYDSTSAVSGGGFNGTAYRWTIPLKQPFNSSLGPSGETLANRTWNLTYVVNGSGEYKVSELYIVGLDPRQVDGAGTHGGITVAGGFGGGSSEAFYVAVVFFLVLLNVVNFVMTRRINQKLNQRR